MIYFLFNLNIFLFFVFVDVNFFLNFISLFLFFIMDNIFFYFVVTMMSYIQTN